MAIGRKTGGRQKGSRNKRTIAREAAQAKAEAATRAVLQELGARFEDIDALGLLQTLYRNIDMPLNVRIEAAGRALPYEKPRLSAVDLGNKDGAPLVIKVVKFGADPPE